MFLENGQSIFFEKASAFIDKHKKNIAILLFGMAILGAGTFFMRNSSSPKIEVLEETTEPQSKTQEIVAEISGAVEKPGVYKLPFGSRVEDMLVLAGGVSLSADREWISRNLNRAAKISDGQKVFIPKRNEQTNSASAKSDGGIKTDQGSFASQNSNLVNINTAGQKELESLYGIGPVYAQNIIEHRPYSNIEELLSKGVLKKNVYEKIKDKISTY